MLLQDVIFVTRKVGLGLTTTLGKQVPCPLANSITISET